MSYLNRIKKGSFWKLYDNWTILNCNLVDKNSYHSLEDGSGCASNQEISDSDECKKALSQLEYSNTHFYIGSWSHAPQGCFVGHTRNGYTNTFWNDHETGKTGNPGYKSICKGQKEEQEGKRENFKQFN